MHRSLYSFLIKISLKVDMACLQMVGAAQSSVPQMQIFLTSGDMEEQSHEWHGQTARTVSGM